jgi:hypothetical protein
MGHKIAMGPSKEDEVCNDTIRGKTMPVSTLEIVPVCLSTHAPKQTVPNNLWLIARSGISDLQ